jgi:hypothetical protein
VNRQESVCLRRGITFSPAEDFGLRRNATVAIGATALNLLDPRMALTNPLPEIQHRVPVHGTRRTTAIPSFHTRTTPRPNCFESSTQHSRGHFFVRSVTGFSYTELPGTHSWLYRLAVHVVTGVPYTELGQNTGGSYTETSHKTLEQLRELRRNCTKPSSTKHNNSVDVFLGRRGGVQ